MAKFCASACTSWRSSLPAGPTAIRSRGRTQHDVGGADGGGKEQQAGGKQQERGAFPSAASSEIGERMGRPVKTLCFQTMKTGREAVRLARLQPPVMVDGPFAFLIWWLG